MKGRLPSLAALLVASVFVGASHATCYESAGARYQLSPALLRAVATVESNHNPAAMNRSHQAATGSYDIGLMQINSRWLPKLERYGITESGLVSDPCLNVQVGAWILSDALRRHGNDWVGVGAYNAACSQLKGEACTQARNRYAWKVYRALQTGDRGGAARSTPAAPASPRFVVVTLSGARRGSLLVADGDVGANLQ